MSDVRCDRVRVEQCSIRESDIVAQCEVPRQAIFGDRPVGGEPGDDRAICISGDERLDNLPPARAWG